MPQLNRKRSEISIARSHGRLRSRRDAQPFFFLFLNDDAWRDHHHEAVGFAADGDVSEQPVDVRHLRQQRHAEFVATFAKAV